MNRSDTFEQLQSASSQSKSDRSAATWKDMLTIDEAVINRSLRVSSQVAGNSRKVALRAWTLHIRMACRPIWLLASASSPLEASLLIWILYRLTAGTCIAESWGRTWKFSTVTNSVWGQ